VQPRCCGYSSGLSDRQSNDFNVSLLIGVFEVISQSARTVIVQVTNIVMMNY